MNTQRIAFEDLDLGWLSVVTFNYDRSFEHFMFESLKGSYEIEDEDDDEVAKKIAEIEIHHVHGSFGSLPWQLSPKIKILRYDALRDAKPWLWPNALRNLLLCASDNITVIHEAQETMDEFNKAHVLLRKAAQVLFLGFGYHRLNLQRLRVQEINPGTFSGTIHGIGCDILEALAKLKPFPGDFAASGQLLGIHGFQRKKVYEFLRDHVSFQD